MQSIIKKLKGLVRDSGFEIILHRAIGRLMPLTHLRNRSQYYYRPQRGTINRFKGETNYGKRS